MEFPFLIGRIRTIVYVDYLQLINSASEYKFPFLIGRIRTEKKEILVSIHQRVSIPHR